MELKDGQTMGIAGLLSENVRETVEKFPGLGDLPILGALFRSQAFVKGETELVIMVTPHLAKPIAPHEIRLPTDSFIEPSDKDFYPDGPHGRREFEEKLRPVRRRCAGRYRRLLRPTDQLTRGTDHAITYDNFRQHRPGIRAGVDQRLRYPADPQRKKTSATRLRP